MNAPPQPLTIEKLIYGGDGLARLAMPDGRAMAVFVPLTAPGEEVEAEMAPRSRGHATARLLRVTKPSPDRVQPGCEYFGHCGGCQWQHIAYPRQLELKREILVETLRRTGHVSWEGEVAVHAGEPWGYRNRVRLQVLPGRGLGYRERESHRILPVTHCPIASPRINAEIARLDRNEAPDGAREIEICADNRDEHLMNASGELRFRVGEYAYVAGPGSFFQTNRFLAAALVETVTAGTAGELAFDLFSGVGLFTLPLAGRFQRVVAVESGRDAVRDLRRNIAGAAAVDVIEAAALDFMAAQADTEADLIVADPPRAGLGQELVAALLAARPRRLHLVSCDPATLGRDLGLLLAGGYGIEAVELFDLFPQTYHIESVVKLIRA